jgi:hypothetical protein
MNINVYKLTGSDRVTLINPDENFADFEEAHLYAFSLAASDFNLDNRYLVVDGTLVAGFAANGSLGLEEASEQEQEPILPHEPWTGPDAA